MSNAATTTVKPPLINIRNERLSGQVNLVSYNDIISRKSRYLHQVILWLCVGLRNKLYYFFQRERKREIICRIDHFRVAVLSHAGSF